MANLTDLKNSGFLVGHATDYDNHTGCTVILCPTGTIGSVDVRGPAQGSRETEILSPIRPNQTINALLFTGGSALGLDATAGVVRFLQEHDIGHTTPVRKIPIVAASVVFDLFLNKGEHPPNAELAYQACQNASADQIAEGSVGAGRGVTIGKWAGFPGPMKGGFGLASRQVEGATVWALAVTNAIGDILKPDGTVLAGSRDSDGNFRADSDPSRLALARLSTPSITNTTLVAVLTDAKLSKVEAFRVASRAHNGMARAIKPLHTSHDGDITYCLASGKVDSSFEAIALTAADLVEEAIRRSVTTATSLKAIPSLTDVT